MKKLIAASLLAVLALLGLVPPASARDADVNRGVVTPNIVSSGCTNYYDVNGTGSQRDRTCYYVTWHFTDGGKTKFVDYVSLFPDRCGEGWYANPSMHVDWVDVENEFGNPLWRRNDTNTGDSNCGRIWSNVNQPVHTPAGFGTARVDPNLPHRGNDPNNLSMFVEF